MHSHTHARTHTRARTYSKTNEEESNREREQERARESERASERVWGGGRENGLAETLGKFPTWHGLIEWWKRLFMRMIGEEAAER
eukprot:2502796-Pleurochrysis_carterae.AAC.1